MKHTPGEWHVDGFNLTAVISKVDKHNYQHICNCNYGYSNPSKFLELNKSNAKLISAAPELLEALKEAPILSMYNKAELFIDAYEKWRSEIKQQAINKATL